MVLSSLKEKIEDSSTFHLKSLIHSQIIQDHSTFLLFSYFTIQLLIFLVFLFLRKIFTWLHDSSLYSPLSLLPSSHSNVHFHWFLHVSMIRAYFHILTLLLSEPSIFYPLPLYQLLTFEINLLITSTICNLYCL